MRWFDNRTTGGKVLVIGLISLGLMIPLAMLRSLISERQGMREQASATVAQGWGGEVVGGGPVLRIPVQSESRRTDGQVVHEVHQQYLLPERLEVTAQLSQAPSRHVGIYSVPVFTVHLKVSGSFRASDLRAAAEPGTQWQSAQLRLPLSEVRSLRELTGARFADQPLAFEPQRGGGFNGIEAAIDLSGLLAQAGVATPSSLASSELPFALDLVLAGSGSFALLPTAATTRLHLAGDWPDPQFQGAFLPAQYHLDEHGFDAQWQVLALNRSFSQGWMDDEVDGTRLKSAAFGVGLYQSVDVYQRSERAVKYALLFIALTFLSFFGWEKLSGFRVHAMQYLFIGLALSTFYLLLLALSEHLAFGISFWLAAAALVGLLGVYVAGFTESARRGAVVAALMSGVYALLYGLLLSEDYALLIGAIALFAMLAALMLSTRRLKWEEGG